METVILAGRLLPRIVWEPQPHFQHAHWLKSVPGRTQRGWGPIPGSETYPLLRTGVFNARSARGRYDLTPGL